MRIMLTLLSLVPACLGPGEAERSFVPQLEAAAAQAVFEAGATEATTRSIQADKVAWIRGDHTAMVDSEWPAGRMTATANIPVVVRFRKDDNGRWQITSATPDAVGMADLKAQLSEAGVRSAKIRARQRSYDNKVDAAHDAFTSAAAEGGLDKVFPGMDHVEIRNCLVIATVPAGWGSLPKARRHEQLEAIGSVWSGMITKHGVKCGDPAFEARTVGGQTLGRWSQAAGAR